MQNGTLVVKQRADGPTWYLRYRVYDQEQHRWVEASPLRVGLVRDLPTENDARLFALQTGLLLKINTPVQETPVQEQSKPEPVLPTVRSVALKVIDEGLEDCVHGTIITAQGYYRNHIIPALGDYALVDLKQRDVKSWLYGLKADGELEGPTLRHLKFYTKKLFDFAHDLELFDGINPASGWRLKGVKSTFVPTVHTPLEALAVVQQLEMPKHRTLMLLDSCGGPRASELAGLRWQDFQWGIDDRAGEIEIQRAYAHYRLQGRTKNQPSHASIPLTPVLQSIMQEWRKMSLYPADADWVFYSDVKPGVPMSMGQFNKDYLRPAALRAGLKLPKRRWGMHAFRHSLATTAAVVFKVDPKSLQALLRHADVSTTLRYYAVALKSETAAVQQRYIQEMGLCGSDVGQLLAGPIPLNSLE